MSEVAMKTSDGIEVYTHEIYRVLDEYIGEQENGTEDLIKNITCFSGAIKRIYVEVFRSTEPKQYNLKTTVNTDDIVLLNNLWDLYCEICYRYHHKPTLHRFAVMLGLSDETFNLWRTGQTRGANREYIESLKKWRSECESAQVDGLESNSIGSIFFLKSNFNWREAAPSTEEYIETRQSTPQEIRQRYASAQKPTLPDFEE